MLDGVETCKFGSAEEAWFWTAGALASRRDGRRRGHNPYLISRPCEPDDVVLCLDRLYRQGRISGPHARVLRDWGERQMAPDSGGAGVGERALWREAMATMAPALRSRGIVK